MNNVTGEDKTKLATNIGRVKRYLDEGYTNLEIAYYLNLSESTVRRYVAIIKEAEYNASVKL